MKDDTVIRCFILSVIFTLQVVFLVFKFTGVLAWAWVWVLAPVWIPVALYIAIRGGDLLVYLIISEITD